MRRFVFTGDPKAPGHDPGAIRHLGHDFTLGGPAVPVPDDVAAVLAGQDHFTEAFGDEPAPTPAPRARRARRG